MNWSVLESIRSNMTDVTTVQKSQAAKPINESVIARIVATIEQASPKGVSKRKIVKYLINQSDITQNDVIIGYNRYYKKNVCTHTLLIVSSGFPDHDVLDLHSYYMYSLNFMCVLCRIWWKLLSMIESLVSM